MTATALNDEVDTILAELTTALHRLHRTGIFTLADEAMNAPRVFVTGEGRSGYVARAFAMRLMHLGITTYFLGDTCTPAIKTGDLLIALSGSGTTAATVRAVDAASAHGCRTVAITSDPRSQLATNADLAVHIPGATKHRKTGEAPTVQPLSSLFDQCAHIALDAVTLRIAHRRAINNDTATANHANTE
jgi:6-phospho-3-hexuloisomerase